VAICIAPSKCTRTSTISSSDLTLTPAATLSGFSSQSPTLASHAGALPHCDLNLITLLSTCTHLQAISIAHGYTGIS
jgi:hypothetical protein